MEDNPTKTYSAARSKPEWRLHVLLAEDNPVDQRVAARLLEKAGQHVVLATTGRQVLAAVEQAGPAAFDLVLMDIQMPEMDGLEATAAIRQLEKTSGRHLPIIAMTAHAMKGDRERCLEGGMDGYISKPVRIGDIFAEIERCLASTMTNSAGVKNHQRPVERLDRALLLERLEGDHELLAELIELFLADAPHKLETMRDALRCGDMPAVERAAHSLKGAAGSLSAQITAGAASRLEQNARDGNVESARADLAVIETDVECLIPILMGLRQEVSK
jgi:two-component system, sensor histidine kinase and response regulator